MPCPRCTRDIPDDGELAHFAEHAMSYGVNSWVSYKGACAEIVAVANAKYRIQIQNGPDARKFVDNVSAKELTSLDKSEEEDKQRKINDFKRYIAARNLQMHDVDGDGNCLYRAISYFFTRDDERTQKYHTWYRMQAVDYIRTHQDGLIEKFQSEQFDNNDKYRAFINAHAQDTTFGTDEMVWSLSQRFRLRIDAFNYFDGFGMQRVS